MWAVSGGATGLPVWQRDADPPPQLPSQATRPTAAALSCRDPPPRVCDTSYHCSVHSRRTTPVHLYSSTPRAATRGCKGRCGVRSRHASTRLCPATIAGRRPPIRSTEDVGAPHSAVKPVAVGARAISDSRASEGATAATPVRPGACLTGWCDTGGKSRALSPVGREPHQSAQRAADATSLAVNRPEPSK